MENIEYSQKYDAKFKNKGFSTKCLHVGQEPDIVNGGVNVPINLSTTYAQKAPGKPFGPYDYSRTGNPTRGNLERLIAGLENAEHSLIWSSGMAAISGIIHLLKTGDEVLSIDDVYGGTQRYFRKISNPMHGVQFNFVNMDNIESVAKALNEKTKMVWIESPTNPTLKTVDIAELVRIVRDYDPSILIVVDNTFMSPYNCKPLDFGVDIVMESATKFIGGHSDIVMGITATNNKEIQDQLYFSHKSMGAVPSPFDCYLAIRGIKTLALRVERQNENALQVAKFLDTHKNVTKVLYPGLESSPYHKIAKKQQKGFGAVISFYINGGLEESSKFLQNLNVFTLAESLGSVESLAEHPALMTHFSVPPEKRKELGIEDGFVRLSIGVEDIEDITADLDKALNSINV